MNSRTSARLIPSMLMLAAMGRSSIRFDEPSEAAIAPPAPKTENDPTTKLREEFSRLQGEAEIVINAAIDKNEPISAKEQTENNKRFERMTTIKNLIDERVKFAQHQLQADPAGNNGRVQLPAQIPGKKEFNASEGREGADQFNEKAWRDDFNHYARSGEIRKGLQFAISSGTGSGAYLPKQVVAPTSVRRLQNAWRGILAAFGLTPIELAAMSTISIPVADDTANTGQAQSETATSGTELDYTDQSLTLSPTLYGSKQLWLSNTVVLTPGWDAMAFILPILQKRLEKVRESAWTTYVLANGAVGKTLASPTALTYAEWIAFEHSLPPEYRTDAGFILSDSLYQAVRSLVDDNHRPIVDLDPTNEFTATIHGKPVFVSEYFQTMIANKTVGAFVSADAIKILDVMNTRMARYQQVPAKPDQIGFELFQNGDFKFITQGLKLLKTAIS